MKPARMLISAIRRDGGTQIRAALDEATVAAYAAVPDMPPVRVFYDGKDHWLSDGFHRVEAALRRGANRINATVVKGDRRAAILDACGANATHGLPRSNADKRRAVETILADSEWSKLRDREVARLACVSHTYVGEVRESLRLTQREVGNVYSRDAATDRTPVPTKVAADGGGQVHQAGTADAGMASGSGDEGVGATDGNSASTPAPDEPALSMDTLGIELDEIPLAAWTLLERSMAEFDGHLRAAQAVCTRLIGRAGQDSAKLQALRKAAHDVAAQARDSVAPASVCLYCKDPNGDEHRRSECNGCRGLGYLTREQMGSVPSQLRTGGAAAKVIDQKAGGYVPRARKLKVELVDEAGAATPFDESEGW